MKYLPLVFSSLVCLICLTNYKIISKKFNLYDKSNNRKIHKGKISNIGGIAIFFLSLLFALISAQIISDNQSLSFFAVMICQSTMLVLLGLVDDKINLQPTSKTVYLAIVFICITPIYQNFIISNLEFLAFFINK